MEFGLDTVIVALIGAVATIYGIREARAGRQEAIAQQAAANKIEEERQELDRLRAIIESEKAETDRAQASRNEARNEAEVERGRRIELETALRLSEEQARISARRSADDYANLLLLVREDIAREAARTEVYMEQAEGQADT